MKPELKQDQRSLISGLRQRAIAALTTPASKWTANALGIDMSHYQPQVDYNLVGQYIDFAIIKCGEGGLSYVNEAQNVPWDHLFDQHVNGLYHQSDVVTMAYYYHLPRENNAGYDPGMKYALATNRKMLDKKVPQSGLARPSIYGWFCDLESWKDYDGTTVITPSNIFRSTVDLIELMKKTYPKLPMIGLYSSFGYLSSYCPQLIPWLVSNDVPFWPAQWPYILGTVNLAAWADVVKYFPSATADPLRKFQQVYRVPSDYAWSFWQWSGDKLTAPGVLGGTGKRSYVDFDFYNGTPADLKKAVGYVPRNVPQPPPPPAPPPPAELTDPEKVTVLWREAGNRSWTLTK